MDIDKVVDIFFLGMVVGACFAVALLRKMGYRKQPDETPGHVPEDSNQAKRGQP